VKNLEFTLLINNIFNQMYEPNGYTFSYFLPGKVQEENLLPKTSFIPKQGPISWQG
jgi:iron complex outermembrane recepter protein